MEDIQQPTTEPTKPATPAVQTEPVVTEPVAIEPVVPGLSSAPVDQSVSEESFLRKNKMLIIGGIVGLIVVTVAVGILLSLKNSEKLEGLMKSREQTQNTQTQEHSVKIPRTK